MRRISSRLTVFYKRIFPLLWFGLIATNVVVVAFAWPADSAHQIMAVAIPILMAIFGGLLVRWLLFDLATEVFLDDHDVVVGAERIPIAQIEDLRATQFFNPERITLVLKDGRKIAFAPPARFHLFSQHPVTEELMKRMLSARR